MSVPIFFQGEVQLAGWNDTHSQGCRVTFWLPTAEDLEPFRLATIRKGKVAGQLFQMVLVEIDPDNGDKPIAHPSNSAHLMLTGEQFLDYARAMGPKREHWDSARAREWAKYVMQVSSLSELDSDPQALARYHELVRKPFARWNGDTDEYDDRGGPGMDQGAGESE